MVRFKSSTEFSKKISKLFLYQKRKVLKLLPHAKVKHVGSTVLPNALTKGDLDVLVIVSDGNFKKAISKLKRVYKINQPNNWGNNYASFKDDKLKFGLQLTSKNKTGFTKHVNLFKNNPKLLKQYNDLKRRYEGKSMKEYRKAKEKFFDKLTYR